MLDSGLTLTNGEALLDEVFDQAYAESIAAEGATEGKSTDSMLFKQVPVTGNTYTTQQFQPGGYFAQKAENQPVPQATSRTGNSISTVINEFSQEQLISRTFMDDDRTRFGVTQLMIRKMAKRARVTSDRYMFGLLRGAFGTTDTNDGVDWGSNAHVRLDGGAVDNLETGVLTPTNLETGITSLLQQPSQDGVRESKMPKLLVVPIALLREAYEITDSVLRPGTAQNEINYVSKAWPGLEIRFSAFVGAAESGTDTQWHLLGEDNSARRLIRESLWTRLIDWGTSATNQYSYKAGYRESRKVESYEQSLHSSGTV